MECLFCEIAKGEVPTFKLYDDGKFIVALDVNPATYGHIIIFPKAHYQTILEMPKDEYCQLFNLARIMIRLIPEVIKVSSFNIIYSLGVDAGQRMPHVVVHVVPRYKDDKVAIGWEPLKMSQEELRKLQNYIINTLTKKFSGSSNQGQREVPKQTTGADTSKPPSEAQQPSKEGPTQDLALP
ncbi:HIT family protein [Nanoarchaeota archaeon]|nr:MAG: HIT family protein [Nanoarchaeota archaeon]